MTPDTFPSLFWAYTAIWSILALYIGALGVRVARLERRLSKGKDLKQDDGSAAA